MHRVFALTASLMLGVCLLATPANAQSAARSFIILSSGNTLPAGLERRIAAAGGRVTNVIPEIGVIAVTGDDAFAARARRISGVRSVTPNFSFERIKTPAHESVEVSFGNPPNSGDDDTRFDLQWGHDAIDAPEAWTLGHFGEGVRVAVLDEGFDLDQADLAPNLDLAASRSFVPGEPVSYLLNDPFSHGTHVAGTIAAADNGFGIIGVAPKASLIFVKVLSELIGGGEFDWVLAGLVYAAGEADADVINMSLGGRVLKAGPESAELLVAMNRATAYANQQGATIIASAGNSAINGNKDRNEVSLPSEAANVISISASAPIGWAKNPAGTFLDNLASYSNFGLSTIQFAAPGGDSAYPGNEACRIGGLLRACWIFDLVFSTGSNPSSTLHSYYWSAGTSMAAPHAAGVAALIIGKNGGEMHPAQVEAALRASADDLGKPGKDEAYGHGRVNAYKAVK